MKQLSSEVANLGANPSQDTLTELFFYCDVNGYIYLTMDGAPYIKSADGQQIMLRDVVPNYEYQVTQATFTKMMEIGDTLVNNRDLLRYGNTHTPFNERTTNHIDCSSFVHMVMYGIPYEDSRYATLTDKNTPKYDFGFQFPDNPYRNEYGPNRYLANDIGHYAADNGFAFTPTPDYSNLKTGDVVFFSTNQDREDFYMNITHVAIVVEMKPNGDMTMVHGNSFDVANYYTVNLFSDNTYAGSTNIYKDAMVLAARFPLNIN